MAQRLSAVRNCDLAAPSSSLASPSASLAGEQLIAELLQNGRPRLPAASSDFQSFLTHVVKLAKILTAASGSAIAFRGEQGTICRARCGEGAPPLGAPVDTSSGISKQCLDSGTSLYCEDIATDGRVDPAISQAIGTRAVAVVPIYCHGEVSGILEVFSGTPGIFTHHHLKRLQQLANWVGSAVETPREESLCSPNINTRSTLAPEITLLVELEPASRAFFRNLADLISLRSRKHASDSSIQRAGWNDVFVDSYFPWKRFLQSVFVHIVVVGVLSGVSRIYPPEVIVFPPRVREARVTYYPPSPTFPASESSRPTMPPKRRIQSAHEEATKADLNHELHLPSRSRAADQGGEVHPSAAPMPPIPTFATSRLRQPELGAAIPVSPAPDIEGVGARRSNLPGSAVVAPPPDLGGGSGRRELSSPTAVIIPPSPEVSGSTIKARGIDSGRLGGGTGRAPDIAIVEPPPSINSHALLTYGAGAGFSKPGVQVVAPPPSIQGAGKLAASTGAISVGGGVSHVVPPPPSLEAGNSGGPHASSFAKNGSQVVPPPPAIQNGGSDREGGRIASLAHADFPVVPPPPSVQSGLGGNGGGGRGRSVAHADSQIVAPPPSVESGLGDNGGAGGRGRPLARADAESVVPSAPAQFAGSSKFGGTNVAKDVEPAPSVGNVGNQRIRSIVEEVQLRLIGLAWAPPRSSYFSNFEVFVAEKWLNKGESQFIKLVYVFLPYQQRLSEYGSDNLKIRKLRVTRDPTCDESLMQIAAREGENSPNDFRALGDGKTSTSPDPGNVLPCYRTTADDYRRTVSRGR